MTEELENKEENNESENSIEETEKKPEQEIQPEDKKFEEDSEIKEEPKIEEQNQEEIKEEKPIEKVEETENKEEAKEEEKEEPKIVPENKGGKILSVLQGRDKKGSFIPMILIMGVSLLIAIYWDKVPFIKNAVHSVLDPTAGELLKVNLTLGMMLIVFIITLITTLVQKFLTDQKALKGLKEEQKILQKEMQKYKEHPEKVAELSKKQLAFIPKTMKLTSRTMLFTGIPFILFFRWFYDTFSAMGDPVFFGFLPWIWFYLIFMMVFSGVLRKVLKVV